MDVQPYVVGANANCHRNGKFVRTVNQVPGAWNLYKTGFGARLGILSGWQGHPAVWSVPSYQLAHFRLAIQMASGGQPIGNDMLQVWTKEPGSKLPEGNISPSESPGWPDA
jgi:hypothetical protein